MGGVCLALAFFLGQNSYSLLSGIPHSVLGVLLFYAGVFHSGLVLQLEQKNDQAIAIVMGALAAYTSHLDWALGAGLALYAFQTTFVRFRERVVLQ
jgi:branched-subunit amino acid transport protein